MNNMIVDNSILYARAIDPLSGRIEKQDTFLCAALKFVAGYVIGIIVLTVLYWVFSFI
jgi:hypothetical protein